MKKNRYESYNSNDWLKANNTNVALAKIEEKGAGLALSESGELLYRLSKEDRFKLSKNYKVLSQTFSSFIGEDIELLPTKKKDSQDDEDEVLQVSSHELKLVKGEKFDPQANEEFIEAENGLYELNIFIPTPYMLQECSLNYTVQDFPAIYALSSHLCNYDPIRVEWMLNREAYFMQGLKKSKIALVLRGSQGSGKGIYFNEVISPIFGYTKTINDKSLSTSYLGGIVENTLYFNLDEISVKKSQSESSKNFLKSFITNDTVTAEKKFKTLDKETNIYGQVLITSNEQYPVEIEPSDRRFTVSNTGEALSKINFLGYGRAEELIKAIKSELPAFTCYLKQRYVDEQKANTALWTPEKQELISMYEQQQYQKQIKQGLVKPVRLTKLQKNIQEYANAIKYNQIWQFEPILFDAPELYEIVIRDLYNNLFKIDNLLPVFKLLYGTNSIKTTTELFKELQQFDIHQFNRNYIMQCKYGEAVDDYLRIYVGY
ncbi:MAG: hypothetical protein C0627_11080 [Sulfurimonas sp.]|nr:MAG: hypothetical protein C0627_11080 [Sulfurimonas sp.]